MTIDMRLISIKDGGKFAMSWIAGTNPKALRSNLQRVRTYTVDIPEVCEDIMEAIKSREDKLSFRILFKLCFGTIRIFAEQVQHLYDVTLNFVCFNTFVLKQYSRKRTGATVTNNGNKRTRLESIDGLDITSLLLESEIFNDYSEEKFKFPNNIEISCEKKQNTSTCIQIKQITIRQISWDNPLPEEEEAFGEASQDDTMMLLSGLSGTVEDVMSLQSTNNRKRNTSFEVTDCSPMKRSKGILNESIDDIRRVPSTYNDDTMSEFSVDCRNRSSTGAKKIILDLNGNDITQDEQISTQGDFLSQFQPTEDQASMPRTAVDELRQITIPETIPENLITINSETKVQNLTIPGEIEPQKLPTLQRKRRRSHLIIDKVTKLSKIDMDLCIENIWQNCQSYNQREHIARIEKITGQEVFNAKIPNRRFQSAQLLVSFKNNFKARSKQNHDINRQLIVEEILGDEYEIHKSDFKLKSAQGCKVNLKKSFKPNEAEQKIEEFQLLPFSDNCNNMLISNVNNDYFQTNGYYENNEPKKDVLSLKCSLDEIDPYAISFDFPTEAGKQRSEWGKEGILMKLLLAWISEDPNINMSTIIVGASRINAALTFHTLLDLAGLQYIEIVKDKTNSIESIKMGPEMIRKINETFA